MSTKIFKKNTQDFTLVLEQSLYLRHLAEFHYVSVIPDQAQSIDKHPIYADHTLLGGNFNCTCNTYNCSNSNKPSLWKKSMCLIPLKI